MIDLFVLWSVAANIGFGVYTLVTGLFNRCQQVICMHVVRYLTNFCSIVVLIYAANKPHINTAKCNSSVSVTYCTAISAGPV